MALKQLRYHEQAIIKKIVRDALKAGYSVSINDGEEETLTKSTDSKAIHEALGTTDEDYIILNGGVSGERLASSFWSTAMSPAWSFPTTR
jgi:hypothetical protein